MTEGQEADTGGLIQMLKSKIVDLQDGGWQGLDTDIYLLEWLKFKKMNLKKTEKAIRKSFKWRIENGIVNPILDFPEDLSFRLPICEDAVSRTGIPVYAVVLKNWRIQSLLQMEGEDRLIRYMNLVMLKMENKWLEFNSKIITTSQNQEVEVMRPKVENFICLLDFKDYPTNQLIGDGMQKRLTKAASKYFPPIIQKVVLINVPSSMYSMRGSIKPKVSSTVEIKILSRDKTKWKKFVSEIIPLDQLPPGFGGL